MNVKLLLNTKKHFPSSLLEVDPLMMTVICQLEDRLRGRKEIRSKVSRRRNLTPDINPLSDWQANLCTFCPQKFEEKSSIRTHFYDRWSMLTVSWCQPLVLRPNESNEIIFCHFVSLFLCPPSSLCFWSTIFYFCKLSNLFSCPYTFFFPFIPSPIHLDSRRTFSARNFYKNGWKM